RIELAMGGVIANNSELRPRSSVIVASPPSGGTDNKRGHNFLASNNTNHTNGNNGRANRLPRRSLSVGGSR
ncbi:MAG: hypothetical protein WCP12_06390, partial [bacterium]